jgi:hypothetical protein
VRGTSELVASGRHLRLAAFSFGSPLLVHLMSERAHILPFNSSPFVGRAPLMAVPPTGDRLLPVLARISAGLKIGCLSCTPCSCSSAFCCRTRVRPALPHHSRARTRVPALLAPPVLRPLSTGTPARCVPLAPACAATLARALEPAPKPRVNACCRSPRAAAARVPGSTLPAAAATPVCATPQPPVLQRLLRLQPAVASLCAHAPAPAGPERQSRAAPARQSSARPNASVPTPRSAPPSHTTRQRAHARRSAPRTLGRLGRATRPPTSRPSACRLRAALPSPACRTRLAEPPPAPRC